MRTHDGRSSRTRRWRRKKGRARSNATRNDPSRTNGIIRLYRGDLNRRWNRIASLIWETVVVNDALRLSEREAPFGSSLPVAAARAATPFDFRSDPAGKLEDFTRWLSEALDDEVLEVSRGPLGRVISSSRWQGTYVRSAYSRGLEHAHRELRRAGIPFDARMITNLFNAPVHAESLSLLYSRQFNELEGITRAVSQQIGRVMADGIATGQGPRAIARTMRGVVHNIGFNRSIVMARTETINTHATATLNRYEDANVQGVTALAEFLTAQDLDVCPECEAFETGEAIPIDAARGIIPVHANCRCVWIPALAA